MEIQNVLEKVLTGNCILFTGSGFSYGAVNIQDKNVLLGYELATLLYSRCGISDHDNNLQSASELFLDEHGEYELIEVLKNEFTIKRITDDQKYIGKLPWKRIYTTNYDDIIEQAYRQANKSLTPISLNESIDQYKDFRKLSVHLNGHLNSLTPSSLNQGFKLTNSSFLTTDFLDSTWVDLFRSDLHTCDAAIFIGFSASNDLDISRILAQKVNTISDRCYFIVSENESQLNLRRLSKFGTPLKIALDGFVFDLKQVEADFEPVKEVKYIYKSFKEYTAPSRLRKLRDLDFHNLVLQGNIEWDLLYQSVINQESFPYFIPREESEHIFEKIENGQTNFVIHSNLGNGKTCFLKGIQAIAIQKGFNVYEFGKYFDLTNSEIEKICSHKTRNLVVVENYSNHFEIIRKFSLFRKPNTILILTERSIINDTNYYALEDIIGEAYTTVNLNKLGTIEIAKLSDLLSSYGLWGKHSSLSLDSKRRIITNDFKSSLRLVMLDIIKSPNIQQKFTNIVDSLKNNKAFYHSALLIISSKILDFHIDLEDLIYLLDDELLNNPAFYNNDQLNEIIDFRTNRITINSAILAEGILHSNKYNHELIPLLVKVVKKLDKTRFNKNHFNILKAIISHSRLQKLFNTKEHNDYRKLVIQFFEEVKNLNYSKRSPFFWLQYAMARLEIRDYKVADQYFNTAYSWAKKREDFDTFQIDNHFARHLLENEIYNGSIESCMTQFLKAHKILRNRTDQNKNRHYPIKVAKNYSLFYDHYFNKLTEQDQKIFLVSCKEILFRIDDYNSTVEEPNRKKVVKECFTDLSKILLKEKSLMDN